MIFGFLFCVSVVATIFIIGVCYGTRCAVDWAIKKLSERDQ